MASPEAHKPCPVLAEWSQLDAVLTRVATSGLMVAISGRVTRQTCIDNGELLVPVKNELGQLPALMFF